MTWATESFVSNAAVEYLSGQAMGTPALDLWVDFMPESPDSLLTITQYGAPPAQHVVFCPQGSSVARLQLHSRSAPDDPIPARTRLWDAYSALCEASEFTQGDVWIIAVQPVSDPELLEHDDRHRSLYVANLDVVYLLT